MTMFLNRSNTCIVIAFALAMTLLSACGGSSITPGSVSVTQTPTSIATLPATSAMPTSTATPIAMPSQGAFKPDCSNYPQDPNKDVYGDIPLPPGSIIGNAGAAAGTYYEFVCTPNGTAASINAFMNSAPAQSGWMLLTAANAPACFQGKVQGSEWLKNNFVFEWAFSLANQEARVQGPPTWVIEGNDISIFGCK